MWTLLAIAAAVLIAYGLFCWRHDVLERRKFEATLSEQERGELRGWRLRRYWRDFAELRQAR